MLSRVFHLVEVDGWRSKQDARIAALILILKACLDDPSLPKVSFPCATGVARGCFGGYFTRNLTSSFAHPSAQRLLVQTVVI
jgi:hypothetical protein